MNDKPRPEVPPAQKPLPFTQCKVVMVDKTGTWTCTAFDGHIGLHSWKAPPQPPVENYDFGD